MITVRIIAVIFWCIKLTKALVPSKCLFFAKQRWFNYNDMDAPCLITDAKKSSSKHFVCDKITVVVIFHPYHMCGIVLFANIIQLVHHHWCSNSRECQISSKSVECFFLCLFRKASDSQLLWFIHKWLETWPKTTANVVGTIVVGGNWPTFA